MRTPGDERAAAVLIGVDGGATAAKAHELRVDADGALALWGGAAEILHERVAGFEPVPLERQRRELAAGRLDLSSAEREQGRAWIDSTAAAIAAVAGVRRPVSVALCFPGLKTADGLGLALVRNGPRVPELARQLSAELARRGIELAAPIGRIASDGEACAHGERLAAAGWLRDVQDAYYIGGGTGLAEAFLLAGRVRAMDELAGWIAKAWELEAAPGRSFEDLIAPGAINRQCAADPGSDRPLGPTELPEARAALGDARARGALEEAGQALAALVYARLGAAARGRAPDHPPRVLERVVPPLEPVRLERVVLGQRLGQLWEDDRARTWFRGPAEERLAEILAADEQARAAWLERGRIRAGLLVASRVRAAPALGAMALFLGQR